jgi:hypothetical protein
MAKTEYTVRLVGVTGDSRRNGHVQSNGPSPAGHIPGGILAAGLETGG